MSFSHLWKTIRNEFALNFRHAARTDFNWLISQTLVLTLFSDSGLYIRNVFTSARSPEIDHHSHVTAAFKSF